MLDLLISPDPQFSIPVRIIDQIPPPSLFFTTVLPSLLSFLAGVIASAITKPLGEFAFESFQLWNCKRYLLREFATVEGNMLACSKHGLLFSSVRILLSPPRFAQYKFYREYRSEILDRVDPNGVLKDFINSLTLSPVDRQTLSDTLNISDDNLSGDDRYNRLVELGTLQKAIVRDRIGGIVNDVRFAYIRYWSKDRYGAFGRVSKRQEQQAIEENAVWQNYTVLPL